MNIIIYNITNLFVKEKYCLYTKHIHIFASQNLEIWQGSKITFCDSMVHKSCSDNHIALV